MQGNSLLRIIGGGQTGADRGGWEAAIDLGIPFGGWVPKGFKAEDGIIPSIYRNNGELRETDSSFYTQRTRLNIQDSDGTILIAKLASLSTGSKLTRDLCIKLKKPFIMLDIHLSSLYNESIRGFIKDNNIKILNIAGNRESVSPGIQEFTRELLKEALCNIK